MTKDASGTVVERYILGGGVDNQLAVTTATGTYYFNRDGLGSVVSITDSTGAVVETYEYTTFGLPTIKNASGVIISESTIGNTLMFTGRIWDAELGIYDYRNRVYNPEMGVFYQTDPLGYADSTNMYAYCVNDPVNFVDPFGEEGGLGVYETGLLGNKKRNTREFPTFGETTEFIAGFGDVHSFGLTGKYRDWYPEYYSVNKDSNAYKVGRKTGAWYMLC